jgi:hypothetical protein
MRVSASYSRDGVGRTDVLSQVLCYSYVQC